MSQATRIANWASAVTPSTAPVIAFVTLTRPKIGTVGLVTVRVTDPLAGTVVSGPGDQVGVPHTKPGDNSPASGGSSCTAQLFRAGTVTVLLAPTATVTSPAATPQSYRTVKFSAVPPT